MTGPEQDDWTAREQADYVAAAHAAVQRHNEFHDRYEAFTRAIKDFHGPIGELLRDIAAQFDQFRRAELRGHTTCGEGNRWDQVVDSAINVADFLNGMDL